MMKKNEYIRYWDIQPWTLVEELHGTYPTVDLIKFPSVEIDTSKFIQFSKDYFDLADQDYERDRLFDKKSSLFFRANMLLGYGKKNTFVLNYGKQGNTNDVLKSLFGTNNFKKLNLKEDTVLMRLIFKFPGNGFGWHIDGANSYKILFPKESESAVRLWMPLSEWDNGHYFQISDKLISHWKPGDTYQIPWGIPHLGVNFGYRPQITLNITGCLA
jgi:hypothetical protein